MQDRIDVRDNVGIDDALFERTDAILQPMPCNRCPHAADSASIYRSPRPATEYWLDSAPRRDKCSQRLGVQFNPWAATKGLRYPPLMTGSIQRPPRTSRDGTHNFEKRTGRFCATRIKRVGSTAAPERWPRRASKRS